MFPAFGHRYRRLSLSRSSLLALRFPVGQAPSNSLFTPHPYLAGTTSYSETAISLYYSPLSAHAVLHNFLPPWRALQFGVALLRFNFIYGDFVHWLGGEYTNADRDWPSTFNAIHARSSFPPPPGLPLPDITPRLSHLYRGHSTIRTLHQLLLFCSVLQFLR